MIHVLELLDNNYSYIISNGDNCLIVDPGESLPILQYLNKHRLIPYSILLTHSHYDHSDGIKEIQKKYPKLTIINNNSCSQELINLEIKIIRTPGHTNDSCCFYIPNENAIFTGDTLFTGLCGRLFESSFPEYFNSLTKLKLLPLKTDIYPGHEYLHYAIEFMESQNMDTNFYTSLIKNRHPSLNSNIELEIKNNPFLVNDFKTFKFLRELKG